MKIDINSIITVLRTASALMIGNSLVVPILTGGSARYWWALLVVGFTLMIGLSIERKMT